jgi:hypothetical protein
MVSRCCAVDAFAGILQIAPPFSMWKNPAEQPARAF